VLSRLQREQFLGNDSPSVTVTVRNGTVPRALYQLGGGFFEQILSVYRVSVIFYEANPPVLC
jgi:hypothetical protein